MKLDRAEGWISESLWLGADTFPGSTGDIAPSPALLTPLGLAKEAKIDLNSFFPLL